jgi:hypothetical protein
MEKGTPPPKKKKGKNKKIMQKRKEIGAKSSSMHKTYVNIGRNEKKCWMHATVKSDKWFQMKRSSSPSLWSAT